MEQQYKEKKEGTSLNASLSLWKQQLVEMCCNSRHQKTTRHPEVIFPTDEFPSSHYCGSQTHLVAVSQPQRMLHKHFSLPLSACINETRGLFKCGPTAASFTGCCISRGRFFPFISPLWEMSEQREYEEMIHVTSAASLFFFFFLSLLLFLHSSDEGCEN